MRVPRPSTRPWVAAAALAIVAILVATGVGNTHATEPADQQIQENTPGGAAVGTPLNASATGGTVSYALTGPDAASFTINAATGEVSLAPDVSPDFEAKADYAITVTAATDVTVRVLNVDEPGAVALSTEQPGAGETITASLTDPDGGVANVRWSWARSDGGAANAIPDATTASYTTATADIGHHITATASYDDAAGAGKQASAATAHPVRNDPPAFPDETAMRQVDENATVGTPIGAPVTAADPNGDDVTYSVTGSADFDIDPDTGQLSVADGTTLDHESQAVHTVTVTATDAHGDAASTDVTINVANVEEAGAVTLSHDLLRSGAVITATLSDPDGSVSGEAWRWSRGDAPISGANASSHTATADDVGHVLTASVQYSDGHGPGKSARAATASEVGNDAPAFDAATFDRAIDENADAGTAAGEPIAATDPNGDPVSYTITDSAAFSVQADGTIVSDAVLDHETGASHNVTLTATDVHGASAGATVAIAVNNVDEAGSLSLSDIAPKVGDTVSANLTDPDGQISAHSWQWQQDEGNAWNDISDANAGDYTVGSADIGHLLRAVVSYADPQGPDKRASAQTETPVANDPPVFTTADPMNVAVAENTPPGDTLGAPLQANDPNGDPLSFSLSGTDADSFSVDADGQITMSAVADYEAHSSYGFTATVSDPAGGSDAITVNVAVRNVEEPGSVVFDTDASPEVNVPLAAALTDPDGNITGEAWQWQVADGVSGPWADLNSATGATYTPTSADVHRYLRASARYTDGHGDDPDTASAIHARPVTPEPNRPPQFLDSLTTTFNISVNVREGVRVAPPFTATDPNGDALTYSIVSDTPGAFTINSATGEVLMGNLELTEDTTYKASISVSDGVDREWREDHSPDDTLELTMTMVNPNIVIESSSRAARPNGLWVDDDIVVTTNDVSGYSNRDQAMVYDRATQQYLEDRGFAVGGRSYPSIHGLWSDGATLYVLTADRNRSNPRGKIFAYRLSDGARQGSSDITLHRKNSHPYGLTGRDGVIYVGDNVDDKIYAYDMASGDRQSSSEINGIDTLKRDMTALWRDGETIWISYWLSEFIRAYDVTTGERKPGLDIQLARENAGPSGIYSDGFNLWALDSVNNTIYGYVLPQ